MNTSPNIPSVLAHEALVGLTSTTDICGNPLYVGCLVRSYDFPFAKPSPTEPGRFSLHGLDLQNERTAYTEGFIREIGAMVSGSPRYLIDVTRQVNAASGRLQTLSGNDVPEQVCPPVNGTPSILSPVTFGVVNLEPHKLAQPDEPGVVGLPHRTRPRHLRFPL